MIYDGEDIIICCHDCCSLKCYEIKATYIEQINETIKDEEQIREQILLLKTRASYLATLTVIVCSNRPWSNQCCGVSVLILWIHK